MADVVLDELDRRIIGELRANGRIPTNELARRLGVTTKTALARLRRLEDAQVLVVRPTVDIEKAGYPMMVIVSVKVQGRSVREVAQDIAAIPDAIMVSLTMGEYDIEVWLRASSLDHANEGLHRTLAVVEGVAEFEPELCLKIHHWTQDLTGVGLLDLAPAVVDLHGLERL